ncbi:MULTISPECIES: hypothetical protein [unclassified Oceanispirochaeta]|uniref:hypothetical protein n=1 Tax=unclassified Oceanispirochaeta TaxID=2635722 RepID=UPI000E09D55F|nr:MULTISPECIES: hypothetical protein [unclassified Oceanispirochaeta]MBF9016818.1 hypothetical protein [Oceanispirochaeta sp. M2]NPD72088.1 hypothetical protein [Oceanispirochaeta sp. M1]RDG32531.1 hypothetical protein DV872_08245 [Oceanispirochaeta sp. M1]
MSLSKEEITALRQLGETYMAIASLPVQQEKVNLWKDLNRMSSQRPMVVIDQFPWNELEGANDKACGIKDPYWRDVELNLRQTIYKWNTCPVDMVVEPYITIPLSAECTRFGLHHDEESMALDEETTARSQHYSRTLKTMDDLEKIKDMKVSHDKALSEKHLDEAREIFSGTAPLKQGHGIQFHLGIWDDLSRFIGMEDVYYEILDNPDFLHACMDRLTDSAIAGIREANALQLHDDISNTCHCSYIYTDELLPGFGEGKGSVSSKSWAFGMAQLFTSVSPAATEEFETPYIKRMAKEFGMIYYGCCEREDDRLDIVKQIPNVKKISCSPWSDRKNFAEQIGRDHIMSNKPSPAFIATTSVNWQEVEDDLKLTRDIAKENGVNLEYILKDISTINNDPSRLTKWAETAMRIAEEW